MLSRTIVLLVAAAFCATASPLLGLGSPSSISGSSGGSSGSTCSAGPVQCCNQVQPASATDFSKILPSSLLGLLPINIQGLNIPVGLDCDPIDVLGIGASSCSAQTVCCENNSFSGLVALGCTPINLAL